MKNDEVKKSDVEGLFSCARARSASVHERSGATVRTG